MRPYLFLLASLFLLATVRASCPGAKVLDCPLPGSPQSIILKGQTFCPTMDTATGLERQGMSCASMPSCCGSYRNFDSKDGFRVIGVQYEFTDSGSLLIPAGKKVRLEFVRETCLGELEFGTQGVQTQESTKITMHYEKGYLNELKNRRTVTLGPSDGQSMKFSSEDGCHLMALDVHAPKGAALLVSRADLCLIDAALDTCGVCNGNGQSCQQNRAAAAVERRSGGRRLLTVEDNTTRPTLGPRPTEGVVPSDWVDSACLEADLPIKVNVACHTQLTDSTCLTVFGFCNPNPYSVYIPAGSANNYFIRDPRNRGQNSFFTNGCETESFSVQWNCTRHDDFALQWVLTTPLSISSGSDTQIATIHREHERSTCAL
jgi:hypothetical protein